jgi:arabinogalactan oligomer/maltooligosaccharide transport system substrate-binding protein
MKTPLRFAALVGALAIVAAACSSGATTAPSGEPSAAPSTEPSAAPSAAACTTDPVTITMWTKEGEADGALQFNKKLTDAYTAAHPNVTFEVINKDVEKLREEFLTSSLANNAPQLLWTVADHIGPFTAADTVLPLDGLVDAATYLPNAIQAVTAQGKLWGVPISYGNQLMLYWNKELAGDTAPADTDALTAKAKELTDAAAGKYGLVFNQTESFWLVPFLGGFGGSVFAEDGVTPTLDTDAMKNALTLMSDWKFTDKVMPPEADYNGADGLFKAGNAAFIINGDWTLGAYADPVDGLGDKLGVGPIPQITGADYPKPYTAGAFLMISNQVDDNQKCVTLDFVKTATDKANQVAMVEALKRLPGNAEAIKDTIVTGDALLAGAAEAVVKGVPQPTNLEMRCVFDSMTTGVRDLFAKQGDPAAIAAAMQTSAAAGVAPGGECAAE